MIFPWSILLHTLLFSSFKNLRCICIKKSTRNVIVLVGSLTGDLRDSDFDGEMARVVVVVVVVVNVEYGDSFAYVPGK